MKKTNISIVGSGNVATHLAIAFFAAGCQIRQVLSRTYEHARLLAMRVDAVPIDDPASLDEDIDVCLLCVGDDALYDLALDLHLRHSLVIHTSGSTPASILKHISSRYGVVWSPQTFIRDIAMDYSRLPLCIEGCNADVEKEIENLVRLVSPCIHHLDGEQRRHAHLASVMVSNFVCAINAMAQDYMQACNLDFSMLRPLAEQTLRKWDYGDLWAQMTGPAMRHDDKTIAMQRSLLTDQPEMLRLYDLMTEIIQSR
ncbi:MAG: DUF2520 domain-containing protein [Bacteroidales bacterium]|nr:DUF2520 domain-containing protein [Bacteroidales bacterium]